MCALQASLPRSGSLCYRRRPLTRKPRVIDASTGSLPPVEVISDAYPTTCFESATGGDMSVNLKLAVPNPAADTGTLSSVIAQTESVSSEPSARIEGGACHGTHSRACH